MSSDDRAERAILDRAEAYRLVEEARQMREERDAALAEVERLRHALAWYADIKHYDEDGRPGKLVGGGWAGSDPQEADWEADDGERARKALGLPEPWEARS